VHLDVGELVGIATPDKERGRFMRWRRDYVVRLRRWLKGSSNAPVLPAALARISALINAAFPPARLTRNARVRHLHESIRVDVS